ncbi:hypothetical protein [Zavarzinia sp.]|uniref:hypothetical protein n=1 Tax=Zavarzinia sp. TaxID=2027920 RepID=UPI0035644355
MTVGTIETAGRSRQRAVAATRAALEPAFQILDRSLVEAAAVAAPPDVTVPKFRTGTFRPARPGG